MTLPKNWRETAPRSNRSGTWRFEVRSPERFRRGTLRTVTLKGVSGVKLIAGKLLEKDREQVHRLPTHAAMVAQAIVFDKKAWPTFRAALEWQEGHFTRLENPPRRDRSIDQAECFSVGDRVALHPATDAWMQGDKYGEVVGFARGKRDSMGRIRKLVQVKLDSGRTRNFAAANILEVVERRENPARRRRPATNLGNLGLHVIQFPSGRWGFVGSVPPSLAFEGSPEEIAKALKFGPGFAKVTTRSWETEQAALEAKAEHDSKLERAARLGMTRRDNPARLNARQRAAARDALDRYFGFGPVARLSAKQLTALSLDLVAIAAAEQMDYERAAYALRGRIGGAENLESYIASLVAGAGRKRNPPKGSLPQIEAAYNDGYNNGRIDKSIGHRSEYSYTLEANDTLEHSDPGVRWRTAAHMGYRDGWDGKPRRRDFTDKRAANPPRIFRGQLRLASFRESVESAVERLVATETELSTLVAQVLELTDRGDAVPEWMRDKARTLQLEKRDQLEQVRTAVARQASAIEEFSTPATKARRTNPAAVKADAIRLYERFHGHAPTGHRFERVPDLSQLVALGQALRIDYQLDPSNARGARNTPYKHDFGPGSTLLTDPTGRVLVIVGNIKVSRAPRGRFGYIREASGG